MANERGKSIDKTHLSIDNAEARGFIHRDYIAHCLRWSHVIKYLSGHQLYKTADILDIGCGREVPLAKTMYSSRLIPVTGSYTGVDVNRLEMPEMFSTGKFPIELLGETDICNTDLGGSTFRVIACFEVLEHVEPEHTYRMLCKIRDLLEPGGMAFLSTPNYDEGVGAAANHVNEMTYKGLYYLLTMAGLEVKRSFGTFASQRDYKHLLTGTAAELYNRLADYYDSNYLATIFAPLYPAESRNVLWEVTAGKQLEWTDESVEHPHNSSSETWTDFIHELEKSKCL